MLKFEENNHKYYDDENNTWKSVTSIMHQFQEQFNAKEQALKSSKNKKSKYYGMDPKQIEEIWISINKSAVDVGNWYHHERERQICEINNIEHNGELCSIIRPLFNGDVKLAPEQKLVNNHIYPEHFMYLNSHKICGQSDLVQIIGNKINISDYKGLSLDTEIPTPEGFKLMKDINVGDVVFDGNGQKTKVLNVSEIHYNPCYKIIFKTGEVITCDHEHRWVISKRKTSGKFKGKNYKIYYDEVELTTEQLLEQKDTIKIKCTLPLDLPEKNLQIDPYVLGVWLGDGSKSCGMVTSMCEKIWLEIENRGYVLGNDVSGGGSGKAKSRTIFNIIKNLKNLNVLYNKHIPIEYLRSSFSQRLDLLRGLMDTDGYYNQCRNQYVMTTTQEWQAKGLSELISSLGLKPTTCLSTTYCTNCAEKKPIKCYVVSFKCTKFSPFLSRNENCLKSSIDLSKSDFHENYRTVLLIEKVETVPTKCLEVESATHTYLVGRTLIKTHNTNKNLTTEGYQGWNGPKMLLGPLSHLEDCKLNIYNVQLSLYMYMVLKHNPQFKPGKLVIHHIIFDEIDEDKLGTKALKRDSNGDPIVKEIKKYSLPYLRDEILSILDYIKQNQ